MSLSLRRRDRQMGYVRGLGVLTTLLLLSGCVNLGPRAVSAGRADYNTVLRDTTDEQLLANLVRLRYRDRPFFLEVSAVTTQFTFAPQLSATAAFGSPKIEQDALLAGGIAYTEQPTISYTPLQGDDFARRLLTPVSLESLVLLAHSGWSVSRLLRVCVQRINGIPNAVTASGPTPSEAPAYQQFNQLAGWLQQLQRRDDVTIGFRGVDDEQFPMVVFSERALDSEEYQQVTRMLGLTPGRREYPIRPALRGDSAHFVGIQTRSMNGMLHYLSHAVRVPDTHFASGLVTATRQDNGSLFDWSNVTAGLMRIDATDTRPAGTAVAVRYRNHWYSIPDNDLDSKSTFSLLAQLFALQAGKSDGLRPVLTIPVGG